mgnify:FL=1
MPKPGSGPSPVKSGVSVIFALAAAMNAAAAQEAAPGSILPYKVVGDAIPQSLTGAPGDPARGRAIVTKRENTCLLCHSGPFPEER